MEDLSRRGQILSFVLDSSVTIAWLMPDERASAMHALFEQFLAKGALVPSLWRLEVANALLIAERRKRVEPGFCRAALSDLAILPLQVDPETDGRAWRKTLMLAESLGLTTYDAAYLELAQRAELPLATLDRELAVAAKEIGVPLAIELY